MVKKFLIALAAGAVLVAATIGASYAQTAPTATPTSQQKQKRAVIDDAAAKLGISGDALAQALKDARKELGAKPAQAIVKVVKDELDVAAKALGLADAKALRAELRGSSLTAVAQKHNVPPSTVANAIKADLNAKIDALVSSGKLKAERATTLKQKASERVDKLMTRRVQSEAVGLRPALGLALSETASARGARGLGCAVGVRSGACKPGILPRRRDAMPRGGAAGGGTGGRDGANDRASRASDRGMRVLDIAAGTGETTLLAAKRVGPGGSVVAVDISASMLAIAAGAARDAGLDNVETQVQDITQLDLASATFDAAISRLGLMFLPDPGG